MNSKREITELIDSIIKKIWTVDIKNDYENNFKLKEDSLKNAFYFHLRNRLNDSFLIKNNVRIYTEYYINGQRIDLAILEIDPNKAEEGFLGDAVKRIIAAVEMKYKGANASESLFYEDIEKVLAYITAWGKETNHYLAFVQEKYFKSEEVISWLDQEQINNANGQIVELYAYWDLYTDETKWTVIDHKGATPLYD